MDKPESKMFTKAREARDYVKQCEALGFRTARTSPRTQAGIRNHYVMVLRPKLPPGERAIGGVKQKENKMKAGDIIELRTIDRKGFMSFQHAKIKNVKMAEKQLKDKGYYPMSEPNTYFCSHQYDKGD